MPGKQLGGRFGHISPWWVAVQACPVVALAGAGGPVIERCCTLWGPEPALFVNSAMRELIEMKRNWPSCHGKDL